MKPLELALYLARFGSPLASAEIRKQGDSNTQKDA
jgi:hypothetical protein